MMAVKVTTAPMDRFDAFAAADDYQVCPAAIIPKNTEIRTMLIAVRAAMSRSLPKAIGQQAA